MATSPDFLRLATTSTRALADTVLDCLGDAVLVVDARHKHLPVVLANATARGCLTAESEPTGIIESSLKRLLAGTSSSVIEAALASAVEATVSVSRTLSWRFADGDLTVSTDIKPLPSPPGQRLVMLKFAPTAAATASLGAAPHPSFDILILDNDLKVTYANANVGAVRSRKSLNDGPLGTSARLITPTSALHPDVYARALQGIYFHDDAVEVRTAGRPTQWFEIAVEPLKNAMEIVGLVVLSIEVTERRLRPPTQNRSDDLRLIALTEHSRDIIAVASAHGILEYVSGGVRNLLGYTAEERQTNNMFENVHPDDAEGVRTKYQELVSGVIQEFSLQSRVRHKDGSYRWAGLDLCFSSRQSLDRWCGH